MGGAIYYACPSSYELNCDLKIINKNQFINNSAESQGGAISWKNVKYLDDFTNIFINNSAPYGSNESSFAKNLQIQFITNNDYLEQQNVSQNLRFRQLLFSLKDGNQTVQDNKDGFLATKLNENDNSKDQFNIVTGTPFSFTITIFDQNGEVMVEENAATATLKLNQTYGISGVVLSNNEAIARKGVFYFNDVLLISNQGSTIGLQLSIQELDTYSNQIPFIQDPIVFNVSSRLCVSGEEYTSDHRCNKCQYGYYLYEVSLQVSACKECSLVARCYGGNVVAPIYGYWRSSNTSEYFVACPRTPSCLGGNETEPQGICSEGYDDVACGNCQPGFSKISNYECSRCPDSKRNSIQISFIMVAYAIYVAFMVRSTLLSADKDKPAHSVYLKIITNHFQLIGIISSVDFSWPNEIDNLLQSQKRVSEISTQVFSFDCFLMGDDQTESEDGQIYYLKLIFYGLLPIILTLASIFYWIIHCAIKRNFSEFKNSVFSTIVIVLFIVHPDIVRTMFASFNCLQIDQGDYRLMADVSQKCFQGKHQFYILVLSLPAIILWAIGIPLFALFLLSQRRKVFVRVEQQEVKDPEDMAKVLEIKKRLGFLFAGYSLRTFYWEIIIIYRKVAIVLVTVFLSTISADVQVLAGMLIIATCIGLQLRYQPYFTQNLNRMEFLSLVVSGTTLYCGMYYITGKYHKYMQSDAVRWIFLVWIIIPNVLFLCFWLYYMAIEVLKMVVGKPKIFKIATCGCVDLEKFKKNYVIENTEQAGLIDQNQQDNQDEKTNRSKDYIDQQNVSIVENIADDADMNIDETFTDINKIGDSKSPLNKKQISKKLRYMSQDKSKKLMRQLQNQNKNLFDDDDFQYSDRDSSSLIQRSQVGPQDINIDLQNIKTSPKNNTQNLQQTQNQNDKVFPIELFTNQRKASNILSEEQQKSSKSSQKIKNKQSRYADEDISLKSINLSLKNTGPENSLK